MTSDVGFLDTETTGLDAERHSLWEVALITSDAEYVWQFPIDEGTADPFALDISGYWERRWVNTPTTTETMADAATGTAHSHLLCLDLGRFCRRFQELTVGMHFVGAVPSFDEERLRRLFARFNVMPRWHYHIIDVEALAVGYLHGVAAEAHGRDGTEPSPPWKSEDLSRALGVHPERFERHTALGDARWAKAIYEMITGSA